MVPYGGHMAHCARSAFSYVCLTFPSPQAYGLWVHCMGRWEAIAQATYACEGRSPVGHRDGECCDGNYTYLRYVRCD